MATKFLSPGVFTTEVDQSFLAQGVAGIGAGMIGRTLKGPAFVPTIVSGFDTFTQTFGGLDATGSMQMPIASKNYLANSATETVVRVLGSADGTDVNSGYVVNEVCITDAFLSSITSPKSGTDAAIVSGSVSAQTLVLQISGGTFASGDVGNALVIAGALTASNNGQFLITAVLSPTTVEVLDPNITLPSWPDGASGSISFTEVLPEPQVLAVLHIASGSSLLSSSPGPFSPGSALGDGIAIAGVPGDANNFVIQIASPLGESAVFAVTASFLTSSADYILKVLNTDPTMFNTYGHYVYRVYPFCAPGANNVVPGSASWGIDVLTEGLSLGTAFLRDYTEGITAWVKSQPIGGMDFNLFRFHTLGHGRATNNDIKVCIQNVKPSPNPLATPYGTFDVIVRQFTDTDDRPTVLESYIGCTIDPVSNNFISRRIGDHLELFDTIQRKFIGTGNFPNISSLIRVELATGVNVPPQAVPWGHRGYLAEVWNGGIVDPPLPIQPNQIDANGNLDPNILFGISFVSGGIDDRMRAEPDDELEIDSADPDFTLANLSASYLRGTQIFSYQPVQSLNAQYPLQPIYASASMFCFPLPFQGGFDGWDLRLPDPLYIGNADDQTFPTLIPGAGPTVDGGGLSVTALLRAIDTIANPDAFDLNLLAIPGVNNLKTCDYARTMVNNRMDLMYVMDITGSSVSEAVGLLQARSLDDNYTACYYPDLKYNDTDNNIVVRVAPSAAVMGALAYNDRVGQVFFAPAGLNRGGLGQFNIVDVVDRLTFQDRNVLYDNRINPIATFPVEGIVVWGQKTLQVKASALDRINVRRLLIYAKKTVASAAKYLLFDPDDATNWQKFTNLVNPILQNIQNNQGVERFKVVMDASTNPPNLVDQNIMTGKIFLQPTKAAEFIDLSFIITSAGVSFGD